MVCASSRRVFFTFIVMSFLICLTYAIIFTPVLFGDSKTYIHDAKYVLGQHGYDTDRGTQSPLYYLLLAGFIRTFGEGNFLVPVVYFQFFLIFLVSIVVFKIFHALAQNAIVAFLCGTALLINLSTIVFGYLILTETITIFLFILTGYFLIKLESSLQKNLLLAIVGTLCGLLILARFNIVFLPLWILVILGFLTFFREGDRNPVTFISRAFFFVIPLMLILNLWCLRNYEKYGFYFLFPTTGQSITKIALLGILTQGKQGDEEFIEVRDIFLNSKKTLITPELGRFSLLKFVGKNLFPQAVQINYGYKIYMRSRQKLLEHFKIEDGSRAEWALTKKLDPFFRELARQSKLEILLLRVYSLLCSFRASPYRLNDDQMKDNLNSLPELLFYIYKYGFMLLSSLFLLLTALFITNTLKHKSSNNLYVYAVILCLWSYFPIINFLYATMDDADRYKYPGDPLMIGLLIFYIYSIFFRPRMANYEKIAAN